VNINAKFINLIAAGGTVPGISPQELRLIVTLVGNMKSKVFMQWKKVTIKEILLKVFKVMNFKRRLRRDKISLNSKRNKITFII
jgi:hypothetical protein